MSDDGRDDPAGRMPSLYERAVEKRWIEARDRYVEAHAAALQDLPAPDACKFDAAYPDEMSRDAWRMDDLAEALEEFAILAEQHPQRVAQTLHTLNRTINPEKAAT